MRILEVNDESLLGCSQEEAAKVLRRSGTVVRLLVCDAFTFSVSLAAIFVSRFANFNFFATTSGLFKLGFIFPLTEAPDRFQLLCIFFVMQLHSFTVRSLCLLNNFSYKQLI